MDAGDSAGEGRQAGGEGESAASVVPLSWDKKRALDRQVPYSAVVSFRHFFT
jgi:hypothetical protein